jgi:drug/metabolite transporter (DMT)-like permease
LGIVMARHAFTHTPLDAAQAAWWRLVGGELLLVLILLWRRQPLAVTTSAGRGGLPKVLAAAVLGTFLGIWLQQAAISQLQAGVAQTLLATAPLFAMGLAALTGRRLGLPAVAGALLALMGVALLASQSG